jgi:uncharacterized delta-60 repeat protein
VTGTLVNPASQDVSVVARYNTDGTLDSTFGTDPATGTPGGGMATLPIGVGFVVALQPDGKIVVGGNAQPDPQDYDVYLLARFTPDGRLDNTFAGVGYLTQSLDVPNHNDDIWDLAIQPDGNIVAMALTTSGLPTYLVQYTNVGTLDTAFGTDGTVYLPRMLGSTTIRLQSDGKIVVTGTPNQESLGAARYLDDSTSASDSFRVTAPPSETAGTPVSATPSSRRRA